MALNGRFIPKHPEKYLGDPTKVFFRSSWERWAMIFFDKSPSILNWNSEEIIVNYWDPISQRKRRYFPDFFAIIKESDGTISKKVIEVKPRYQIEEPKPKRNKKTSLNEAKTYLINRSKWAACEAWCQSRGFTFQLLDEYSLGLA